MLFQDSDEKGCSGKEEFEVDLCRRVQGIAWAFAQALCKMYQPLGLTPPQAMVLAELFREDGQKISQLAAKLNANDSNISMICQRLERNGYLTRVRSPEDQRVVQVMLTERSRGQAFQIGRNVIQERFPKLGALSKQEKETIMYALDKLKECLTEQDTGWDSGSGTALTINPAERKDNHE